VLVTDSYQYGVFIEDPSDFAVDEEGGVGCVWDRWLFFVVCCWCEGEHRAD